MKLLIVQTGFLGDAVLASGMLRGIAAAATGTEVGMLVRSGFEGIFHRHPALHRLHTLDKKRPGGIGELSNELRDIGYDLALLPHRSLRSAMIVRRAGIPRRIGFRQSDAPWLLTDRVEYLIARHETDRNAMLLDRAGIATDPADRLPWLLPDASARAAAEGRLGADPRPIVAMAPGSVWETKRWTPEGYAALAGELLRMGKRVVLIGSNGELEICRRIASLARLPEEDLLCGALSLTELVALIALAERVITNDSAPLHIAESVGTPVTAVFGPTVPEFGFGPRRAGSSVVGRDDLPCRPCRIHGSRRCPIGTHECMTSITAADLLRTFSYDHEREVP